MTPSAPVICFQGSTNRTNGFLAHLNPSGALIDATYLGNSAGSDVISVGGLSRLPGGSVLVAGDESGAGVVSKVQFGSGGWTAPACLSTSGCHSRSILFLAMDSASRRKHYDLVLPADRRHNRSEVKLG